jgi:tetratricopeptide (TPR) repeat protein
MRLASRTRNGSNRRWLPATGLPLLRPTCRRSDCARICYAQKKYEEAALLAQRAIEREPDCEGSWNLLGRAYFATGRFEEAAALTERGIEANGDDYNTYIPYVNALERWDAKKKPSTSGSV